MIYRRDITLFRLLTQHGATVDMSGTLDECLEVESNGLDLCLFCRKGCESQTHYSQSFHSSNVWRCMILLSCHVVEEDPRRMATHTPMVRFSPCTKDRFSSRTTTSCSTSKSEKRHEMHVATSVHGALFSPSFSRPQATICSRSMACLNAHAHLWSPRTSTPLPLALT